jgi:hypothetical protein
MASEKVLETVKITLELNEEARKIVEMNIGFSREEKLEALMKLLQIMATIYSKI